MDKGRYALVGTGMRALCFGRAILERHAATSELVALFDRNPLRMQGLNRLLGTDIPSYTDFSRMARETRPTHAIIGTPDATHHEYIAAAFECGMDAITEKPMTTDAEKVRFILEQEAKHGREVTVTFNYRFAPYIAKVKELLRSGEIGAPMAATLEWCLDHQHGQEYFRRWHAHMANSGGLLVHKATHHFDLVNWLLDDEPDEVSAFGALRRYGRNGTMRGERCTTCAHAGKDCPCTMTIHEIESDKPLFDALYFEAEAGDGYLRDRCLFDPSIDIYDTMSACVKYKSRAQLAYSLNAYSPVAGYRLAITGTEGRLEASERHAGIDMVTSETARTIRLLKGTHRRDVTIREVSVPVDRSNHGGGDNRLFRHLFEKDVPDPLNQMAGSRDGAQSCLVGIAANLSIAENRIVSIRELLEGAGASNRKEE